VVYLLLGLASLMVIIPVLWMLSTALKTDQEVMRLPIRWLSDTMGLHAFIRILVDYPFPIYFRNSFVIVLASTGISLGFAALTGYGVSRFKFTGKKYFLAFLLITQMFPSVMLLVPFYQILKSYGLSNTHLGLMLVYVSFTIPFCSWMMYGYYDSIPKELDDAAAIDGCGRLGTFWIIITPLARPGIAATAIYSFLTGWNEYMFATILTSGEDMKTVPVGIGQLIGQYRIAWNDMMAASLMASIPLLILFLFFQKHLIRALTAGAVKS
jgi:ABC-type glycerol-3-phosphate transport system permease component